MDTREEMMMEEHADEVRFFDSIRWIKELFPGVYDQFVKDLDEHEFASKHDEYYAYCHSGNVPVPRCAHCSHFDPGKGACTVEWNNLDESYYIPERDDRDGYDLCGQYDWDGSWEED